MCMWGWGGFSSIKATCVVQSFVGSSVRDHPIWNTLCVCCWLIILSNCDDMNL